MSIEKRVMENGLTVYGKRILVTRTISIRRDREGDRLKAMLFTKNPLPTNGIITLHNSSPVLLVNYPIGVYHLAVNAAYVVFAGFGSQQG